ncbi:MAG: outer membrane lipoprotein-sorting protein [Magnetococcus sp. DMHC-8]
MSWVSLWWGGGLFTNADLLMTDFGVDYQASLLEEQADSLALLLSPRDSRLPYTKQIMRVDRKSMLPRSLSQFGANGVLLKTITFDKLNDVAGSVRPGVLQATSGVDNRQTATWQLGSLKSRSIPPEAFTKSFLPRLGTLFK